MDRQRLLLVAIDGEFAPRSATMDTLISLGTSVALLWSLYGLFLGTAGERGMTHDPTSGIASWTLRLPAVISLIPRSKEASDDIALVRS